MLLLYAYCYFISIIAPFFFNALGRLMQTFLPYVFHRKKEAPAVGTFGAMQELRYFQYIKLG